MSSTRGDGAMNNTQKGGSGPSNTRQASKNQDDVPGSRPLDMLDVVPSTHKVVEPVRALRTMEVDESRRSTLIDDVSSSITSDGLIIIRKKFHLPDDLVMVVPKKTDRARDPPNGFFTMYEMTLCAGRKWLDFSTRDPSKNWSSSFFFVKNDWGLFKKWGRLKELPNIPRIREEDILKILNFSETKSLQEELRHISQYVLEEKLFKVGLSIHVGRSHAVQLKKSKKVREASPNILRSSSNNPSRGHGEEGSSLVKKRRVNDVVGLPSDDIVCREVICPLMVDVATLNSDREVQPLKVPILEEMIQKMDVESQFDTVLDEWNVEFVKVKYLHGEYK
ncbi:hypothetical protein IEQ34_012190 [Dendrobium chrysotoxum]|uniref:Uncharacterized protein n=1 Tax=Dendrobium chrysotoxum TaxID=161865 RepID=A0AAV7GRU3_DENCH|nr:hypothetical protein IEQ34_012190 [Dendrobium chrysotoxum]